MDEDDSRGCSFPLLPLFSLARVFSPHTSSSTTGGARIAPVLEKDSETREIGSLAVWSVSSAKPGNGVELLRDNNTDTYWQSDGMQPHMVSIQFQHKVMRRVWGWKSTHTGNTLHTTHTPDTPRSTWCALRSTSTTSTTRATHRIASACGQAPVFTISRKYEHWNSKNHQDGSLFHLLLLQGMLRNKGVWGTANSNWVHVCLFFMQGTTQGACHAAGSHWQPSKRT